MLEIRKAELHKVCYKQREHDVKSRVQILSNTFKTLAELSRRTVVKLRIPDTLILSPGSPQIARLVRTSTTSGRVTTENVRDRNHLKAILTSWQEKNMPKTLNSFLTPVCLTKFLAGKSNSLAFDFFVSAAL